MQACTATYFVPSVKFDFRDQKLSDKKRTLQLLRLLMTARRRVTRLLTPLFDFDPLLRRISPVAAVRPEGANHQWRKNTPGELSINPVSNRPSHPAQDLRMRQLYVSGSASFQSTA